MQPTQGKDSTGGEAVLGLAVALELASASWKVALHDGRRRQASVHTLKAEGAAARLGDLLALIEQIKRKWCQDEAAPVQLICEAGQDGFWIARALIGKGIDALVVDPASIPVERQARRAKTDRLDAIRLVMNLLGWRRGERNGMRVVRIPSEEDEALRHWVRERGLLQKEIGQHRDRMRKLLRTVGCWVEVKGDFAQRLARGEVVGHDGQALPVALRSRLERECKRLAQVEAQLAEVQTSLLEQLPEAQQQRVAALTRLKGVGPTGGRRLILELFWRNFENRREVGACPGLVPQPYDSGQSRVDQGISKQGNRRVRALLIEMAWMWLRYQPDSAISQWFAQRSGPSTRTRRIAIVAVARRLVIALWRYLTQGVIPEGAVMKTA